MSQSARATIKLQLASKQQLNTLFAALKPETEAPATRRATTQLEMDNLFLVLTVTAEDTVALRSTLNAYLRWINSTINIIEVLNQHIT